MPVSSANWRKEKTMKKFVADFHVTIVKGCTESRRYILPDDSIESIKAVWDSINAQVHSVTPVGWFPTEVAEKMGHYPIPFHDTVKCVECGLEVGTHQECRCSGKYRWVTILTDHLRQALDELGWPDEEIAEYTPPQKQAFTGLNGSGRRTYHYVG